MQKVRRVVLALVALMLCAGKTDSVWAHHSYSMFDKNKTIQISGTVKDWQFMQPHAWLDLVVEDKDGGLQQWAFEAGGSSALMRMSHNGVPVNRNTIRPGDKVTVTAWALRDGRIGGYLLSVKFDDGSVLELFPPGPQGGAADAGNPGTQ